MPCEICGRECPCQKYVALKAELDSLTPTEQFIVQEVLTTFYLFPISVRAGSEESRTLWRILRCISDKLWRAATDNATELYSQLFDTDVTEETEENA